MPDLYQKNAAQILQKCSSILQKQQTSPIKDIRLSQNISKKKDKTNQLLFSTINAFLSPHQQSQNNKIIQKLKRKNNKKRELKEVVIRKTDLGENQLIFTKQELQRLKQVDNEQMYGNNFSNPVQNKNFLSQIIPSQPPNKKYFSNANFDNQHDEIINYLDWVDLDSIKNSKQKNKNKIINFQKRQKSPSNSLTTLNKQIKIPLPLLMQKHSSPFRGVKNLYLAKAKSCYPLIKKNSVDKGFLNSINTNSHYEQKRVSDKQKLEQILFKVNQKIEKQLSSVSSQKDYIYMTQQRKQALFQCEILRKIKRQIGPKFYHNLQLTYGNKQNYKKTEQNDQDSDKQNDQKSHQLNKCMSVDNSNFKKGSNCGINIKQKGYLISKQKNLFQSQAQKMIQKNRNRLKEQRKRVIQKINC